MKRDERQTRQMRKKQQLPVAPGLGVMATCQHCEAEQRVAPTRRPPCSFQYLICRCSYYYYYYYCYCTNYYCYYCCCGPY
jgi:hypothetical protein